MVGGEASLFKFIPADDGMQAWGRIESLLCPGMYLTVQHSNAPNKRCCTKLRLVRLGTDPSPWCWSPSGSPDFTSFTSFTSTRKQICSYFGWCTLPNAALTLH